MRWKHFIAVKVVKYLGRRKSERSSPGLLDSAEKQYLVQWAPTNIVRPGDKRTLPYARFGASPCSGPVTGHLRRRGLGQTDKNREDVQLQTAIAVLVTSLKNSPSLFFVC